MITIEDFDKVEMRVGTVISVSIKKRPGSPPIRSHWTLARSWARKPPQRS